MGKIGRPRHPDILTPREWEVIALLRERLTNEEIAHRLGISHDGAKYHVSQILSKLGVATREEAAVWRPGERRAWWARWPVWLKIAGAATIVAAAAGLALLAWGVLRTGGPTEEHATTSLHDPAPADLSQMVLQLEDLPDGYTSVPGCEHQNPVPSSNGSFAVSFYETAGGTNCVVSYAFLSDSADEASRSLGNFEELFAYINRPVETLNVSCSLFHEVESPQLGDEARAFAIDCPSCPGDASTIYWLQFRVGRVLASPRVIDEECQPFSEAIAYATKQEDRIEAVLVGTRPD